MESIWLLEIWKNPFNDFIYYATKTDKLFNRVIFALKKKKKRVQ
jgi:hypothetical protein